METLEYAVVYEEEAMRDPYPVVYVEDDGSYRELHNNEKEYLEEKYHPADRDRPIVKFKYDTKTSDGKMGGFCMRNKLPEGLSVGEAFKPRKWWQLW